MPSFTQCPVIDNHAHVLEPEKATIEAIWLAREFFHGIADTPSPAWPRANSGEPPTSFSAIFPIWASY